MIYLEPISEHQSELGFCRTPFASRHFPILGDFARLVLSPPHRSGNVLGCVPSGAAGCSGSQWNLWCRSFFLPPGGKSSGHPGGRQRSDERSDPQRRTGNQECYCKRLELHEGSHSHCEGRDTRTQVGNAVQQPCSGGPSSGVLEDDPAKRDPVVVEKRMRCSKCGAKKCHLRAVPIQKPRGILPAG
jgi:hypothetical protein